MLFYRIVYSLPLPSLWRGSFICLNLVGHEEARSAFIPQFKETKFLDGKFVWEIVRNFCGLREFLMDELCWNGKVTLEEED